MNDLGMEVQLQTSIGPRTGRVYVRDPSKCSKINGIKYQCQQKPAPGSKFCQHHIDINKRRSNKARKLHTNRTNCQQGKGKGKFKRGRPSKWSRYEKWQIEKNEDEDSHKGMDNDGDRNEEQKSQKYLSDNLPLKDVSQRGRNNKFIERKLYRRKSLCDSIYQSKLDFNDRSIYKSWIEHQKMKSFDEENLCIEEWRRINNLQ